MKKEHENINDSFLKDLPIKGGFKTPEGYFEKVEITILQKIKLNESLNSGNVNGGFQVPTDYFENNKKLILTQTKNHKKASIINLNWKWAAGIAAILLAVYGLFELKTNNNNYAASNKVTDAEIIDYLANNDIKLEWINETNANLAIPVNNQKEVEQYLLDHAEEQVILEEL